MRKAIYSVLLGAAFLMAMPMQAQRKVLTKAEQRMADEYKMEREKRNKLAPMKSELTFIADETTQRHERKARHSASQTFEAGWTCDFQTASDWDLFTVIDANGDGVEGSDKGKWTYWVIDSGDAYASYNYSQTNKADDWLITPGINLKAGKKYYLLFKTRIVQTTYPERMEVKYGSSATVEGMTQTLMSETEFTNMEFVETQLELDITEDGTYFFGFHAVSEPFMFSLMLDDIALEAAPETKSPGAVTNLLVTPEPTGKMEADISFTAPTVAFDGSELTSITGIRIINNGEEIADMKRVKPGDNLTFTDTDVVPPGEMNTYTVIAYNAEGEGAPASASAWIGLDYPSAPANVVLSNDATSVKLSWDASVAEHGGVFRPEEVKYGIYTVTYSGSGSMIPANLVGTVENGVTEFIPGFGADLGARGEVAFGVIAENQKGEGEPSFSNTIMVGVPDDVPYIESFDNGKRGHDLIPFAEGVSSGWTAMGVGSYEGADADATNGYMLLRSVMADSVGFSTFKVSLAESTSPKLAFRMKYHPEAPENTNGRFMVEATKPNGEIVTLINDDASALQQEEWITRKVDLSQFKDERYVMLSFAFVNPDNVYTTQEVLIDNVNIRDLAATDLMAKLEAPAKIERGKKAELQVYVLNNGDADVDNYMVKVMVGSDVVAEESVAEKLASFEMKTLSFDYDISLLTEGATIMATAELEVEDDGMEENDKAEAVIELTDPKVSPVLNLTAELNDQEDVAVELKWDAPSPLVAVTEDFEDYEAWAVEGLGEWTLVDGDGGYTGGGFLYGGDGNEVYYKHQGEQFAYIVMNPTDWGEYEHYDISKQVTTFNAHSGNQSLASVFGGQYNMQTYMLDNIANDDWLISPELPGAEQTISFFVKDLAYNNENGSGEFPQTYEVLVSSTDTSVENFTIVGEPMVVSSNGEWQEVSVQLPEGTKHFAIRHTSSAADALLFMIDDITYFMANGEVDKYRVYRDGELIGETTDLNFVDNDVDAGDHKYQVTVLFTNGVESAPATIDIVVSGIAGVISNGEPADVYTIDGILVKTGATNVSDLKRGVYVVRGKKVVIK